MFKIDIDPLPEEPPDYKIHSERRGRGKVWVITKEGKLQTIMTEKALAHAWVNKQEKLNKHRRE
jgi:hypothetical protein